MNQEGFLIKSLKEKASGIVFSAFEVIVGLLLLINPAGFTSAIIMVAGVVLMALGLFEIIKYFRTDAVEAARSQMLVKGLVAILTGAFCAFRTEWFIVTFPVLTIIYGVVILITGMGKIQLTVDMLRLKSKKWFWAAINAAISVIGAVVILNAPFASTAILWMFTGATLMVEGVFDLVTLFTDQKTGGKDML